MANKKFGKNAKKFSVISYQGNADPNCERGHYAPTGRAKIKNSDNIRCWLGCRKTGSHSVADVEWSSRSGKCLGVSYKTKHGDSIFVCVDFITSNVAEL